MKRLLDLLARSPIWAIRPEVVMLALSMLRLGEDEAPKGVSVLDPERLLLDMTNEGVTVLGWEAARPRIAGSGNNKIAVVPVHGVLTKDGPSWYGSNYDTISSAVESAAANPDVKHIVLAVNSPGGEITGLPETAAVISQAAKVKPVTAMVDGMSASAAYWLTSQARDIVLTPSGEVGSVGVRMMHMDVSKMMDNFGVKVTELSSGDFKTEWSPYKPLSEDAVNSMTPRLQATHQDFLNAISDGRGERASQQIRDNRFGEGRMFSAQDALGSGLVDKVLSGRDFYKALLPAQEEANSAAPAFPIRERAQRAIDVARARVFAADEEAYTVDGKQCTLSCYAYRPTKELKDAKLPIECTDHDAEWEKAHIRDAISRWPDTEMPDAEEKKKARSRILAAAKKHGIAVNEADDLKV